MKNYTYIRKPETIQAVQAFRDNRSELENLAPGIFPWTDFFGEWFDFYQIPGGISVGVGKWLIKHEDGSFSAMTDEDFNKTYMRDESYHIFGDN